MNVKNALAKAIFRLQKSNIKNPYLDAEILLSFILNKPQEFIFTHPEYKLTKFQISNYQLLISRRQKGEPVAYLTGHKEFYGLDFFVNKNVLIPRPETELMVDKTLSLMSNISHPISLIDIGTGSGCIIITLQKILKLKSKIINYKFFATDISKDALKIAKNNAKKHGVDKKIKFLPGDLLEPLIKNSKYLNNPKNPIIITANLPYLTPSQINNSPTIKKEPKIALVAGSDGLKYYQKLFKQIKQFQKICNVKYMLCEIDPRQKIQIGTLIKKELKISSFQIKKDLRGHSRLAIINLKN
jgi:release factor glutamine methyltransferase